MAMSTAPVPTGAMWRRGLASAFRTALACAIVGAITLFGPPSVTRQVAFPAFSYVTLILVVTDAAVGDALRGCWLAARASVQVVWPAVLVLWLIGGPQRMNNSTTAAVVAVNAFLVALPERGHLVGKRVALGQIVIVYVVGFIKGAGADPVMHPVHVAASTALGVAACVVAVVLPYPCMATWEVKENCKLYIENASERLKLYVKAFSAQDNTTAKAIISQANSLNHSANKFLQRIKSKQESMKWERIPLNIFKKSITQNPGGTLQRIETILRGMENALVNCKHFPVQILNTDLRKDLASIEDQFLDQIKTITVNNAIPGRSSGIEFSQTLQMSKDLPPLFFLFCFKLIDAEISAARNIVVSGDDKKTRFLQNVWSKISAYVVVDKRRIMPALKCAISLGFAVLFGLIYSKEDGYWSGLPVAISLAPAREATFKVANIKAQGTVLGTVYGVLGCFIFEKYVKIRFVSLIPWFVFCSLLRQSRMYGQAGGVSAVIGAVLILGRKNFGEPSDFAIARIVETFIGLSCAIATNVLLQPTRASVLAKMEMSVCLGALRETIESIGIDSSGMEGSLSKLKSHVVEVGKLIEEAEVEPNFWFLPFNSVGYNKLRASLSKMVDLLQFGRDAIRLLECKKSWKEGLEKLDREIDEVKEAVCSGIKCFEEVSLVKSLDALERGYEKRGACTDDIEMGKSGKQASSVIQWPALEDGCGRLIKAVDSFLQHLNACDHADVKIKNRAVLTLSAVTYCLNGVAKEAKEIEKGIQELVQWENPSRQVDLNDVSCKLNVLEKNVSVS